MKKRTTIIIVALILVALIAVLFVNMRGPSPAAVSSTTVVTYAPSANTSNLATKSGSCWTNSIAAPYRADAWRCMVGNAISDPCFEIEGTGTLMCVSADNTASNSDFVLSLTEALPPVELPAGDAPTNWAWKVELEGGTICTPFTGTRPFTADQKVGTYGCSGADKNEEIIFGDLDNATERWIATVGTISEGNEASSLPTAENLRQVNISTVWR